MHTIETPRSHRGTETLCLGVNFVSRWWNSLNGDSHNMKRTVGELNKITGAKLIRLQGLGKTKHDYNIQDLV
jgi:hypothetical protein